MTFTQGGWGSTPNGNNPGMLLQMKFSSVYPGGVVVIGGSKTFTFKNHANVTAVQRSAVSCRPALRQR
jgi:hypothetical protein